MKTKNLITFIFILISEIIFGQQATVTVGSCCTTPFF